VQASSRRAVRVDGQDGASSRRLKGSEAIELGGARPEAIEPSWRLRSRSSTKIAISWCSTRGRVWSCTRAGHATAAGQRAAHHVDRSGVGGALRPGWCIASTRHSWSWSCQERSLADTLQAALSLARSKDYWRWPMASHRGGEVRHPHGRHPTDVSSSRRVKTGRRAVTRIASLEGSRWRLWWRSHSRRSHPSIRVHFAEAGFPYWAIRSTARLPRVAYRIDGRRSRATAGLRAPRTGKPSPSKAPVPRFPRGREAPRNASRWSPKHTRRAERQSKADGDGLCRLVST